MVAGFNNLTIETAGTEEEAYEGMSAALGMEVEADRGSEVEDGGGGTQRALEALEFLTQEADPSGTTLVDACNGFNELSRLAMLCTVRHRWPAGRGLPSIAIIIGHNFSSASRGICQSQS